MKTYIYEGGFGIVAKSGVGSAIKHQKNMLKQADIEEAKSWKEADIVHINTVFPDSVLAACLAKMQGKKVVYYGHSTMEDFRNSFIGSNRFAPLFKKWICFCYGLGDIVITPTEYSKGLLKSYGIQKKIYAVSNGVDTEFFQSRNKEKEKQELHEKYKISMNRKVVVSAGHLIKRKGILDFLKLAKMMPETTFIWFGGGNDSLVTQEVKEAVKKKSENVIFAGYVEAEELRNAYCGADAFAFFSYEETEGIVVLEALACEVPVVLRDIPVYKGWIQNQMQAYKVHNLEEYKHNLMHIFKEKQEELKRNGADLTKVRKMSRESMETYRIRAKAISEAEILYGRFAIATLVGIGVDSPTVIGAQVANELLDIDGIEASFVLTGVHERVYISARSIDEVNVQKIMEEFGGGGHLTVAGAQLVDVSLEEAKNIIHETLRYLISKGEI